MWEFPDTPYAQPIIMVAILFIIMAIGYYLVGRFRDNAEYDRPTASDLLTNFREMHHEGDVDEKEYRAIKTVLGERLQQEVNGNEDEG